MRGSVGRGLRKDRRERIIQCLPNEKNLEDQASWARLFWVGRGTSFLSGDETWDPGIGLGTNEKH